MKKRFHAKTVKTLGLFLVSVCLLASSSFAAGQRWRTVADETAVVLDKAAAAYAGRRATEAKALLSEAYFSRFEESGMEGAVAAHISARRKAELESMFGGIRNAVDSGAPVDEVRDKAAALASALRRDADRLTGDGSDAGAYSAFFNSFMIILREGFEAILVLSAICAYLVKTGQKPRARVVYKGAGLAVAASVLTAALLSTIIRTSGAGKEAVEGVVMLLAASVLFYVSWWLISKMEAVRWRDYIRAKVEGSSGKGNFLALGLAAFLSVYREGAETILFYEALYSGAPSQGAAIAAGLGAGCLLLIVLFILIRYAGVRIPTRPFFAVTSALLYLLAFSFAGKGALELQEAGYLSSTSAQWLPTIGLFGIYPTWEGAALQMLLIMALVAGVVYGLVSRAYLKGDGNAV
ncbi:MAG: FTR1 family iron permease [Deltaproteobacteria bacterium]|nr:FTR1 family iron permease [Deltaproteobacteria bacterium]